jgi:hypothetical protein
VTDAIIPQEEAMAPSFAKDHGPSSQRSFQGWKKPNFFQPMHWVFGFNAKTLSSANKTMVLFELLPYVFQPTIIIKGGRTQLFPADALEFCFDEKKNSKITCFWWTSDDWVFIIKKPRITHL